VWADLEGRLLRLTIPARNLEALRDEHAVQVDGLAREHPKLSARRGGGVPGRSRRERRAGLAAALLHHTVLFVHTKKVVRDAVQLHESLHALPVDAPFVRAREPEALEFALIEPLDDRIDVDVENAGNLPGGDGRYSLYCAVIIKQVDAKTRAKTGINELLRGD
jgi:hypothetical protein